MLSVILLFIWEFDVLIVQLRFCSKVYEPFNASDTKKYVISDDYTPMWEVSFEHFGILLVDYCMT